MAISAPVIVGSTFEINGNATGSVTTTQAVGVDETLWVICGDDGSGTTLTVTDGPGNTYTPIFATPLALADNYLCRVFECSLDFALASGSTITVTRSGANATVTWDKFIRAAKIASDFPLVIDPNGQQRGTGTGTAWSSGASAALTASGIALGVAVAGGAPGTASASTPNAAWTELDDSGATSSWIDWTMTYRMVPDTAAQTASGTWQASDNWGALVFTLYEDVPVPATGPGQYGWGTYGAGDYGPDFGGGAASTPVAGSDALVLSESASIQIISTVVDSGALAEARALSGQYAVADSAAQTEGTPTIVAQEDKAVSDSLALNEAMTLQENRAVSDSLVLADASALTAQEDKAVSDSLALADASALTAQEDKAVSDSLVLADASALTAQENKAVSDSLAWADASALGAQEDKTSADQQTQSESPTSVAGSVAGSDAHAQAEQAQLDAAAASSDALSAAEASALTASVSVTDSATLSESATVGALLSIAVSDAWNVAELAAIMPSLSASDAAVQSEQAANIAREIAASDSAALNDAAAVAAAIAALDSSLLSEDAAAGRLESISASDALTLASEVSAASLSFTVGDSATQSDAVLDIRLATSEAHGLAEAASIAASLLATEALSLAVESATGGEYRDVSGSDLLTLAESSDITAVVLKAASDVLSATDAATLQALLSGSDTSGLAETLTLAAQLLAQDGAEAADVAALAATVFASDAFAAHDLAALNTAAFVRILAAVASAAATIRAMTSASVTSAAARADATISATGVATATTGDAEALL